ncbi:MAG: photosynthetic complex assembly protein PuhC [Rubrivivax sp.]|nr:photosynthetic complex assembly protein PuhC [Rubrivivax sp.]
MDHHSTFANRPAVLGISVLLVGTLLSVVTLQQSGFSARTPDAPTTQSRQLRFEDRPDGSVAVIDGVRGHEIQRVQGEAGFLRGSLRALTRERQRRGLGPAIPFELSARANGRLTLHDPATGERLDLESFGPTNAAVYARMLALP